MNKEEKIKEFVKDFCAVGKLRIKSEVRSRLNELLKAQRIDLKEFNESCKFYCNYHKIGNLETTMICGNLEQVIIKLLKQNEI